MLPYSVSDVLAALDGAKNVNSALKKFLKNEVRSDPKSERFIKDLKIVLASKDSARRENFIGKSVPVFEPHLFVLTRYAYAAETGAVADEITTRFAEEFNATYELGEDGFKFRDEKAFTRIVKDVMNLIEDGLKKQGVPLSGFSKNVMLHHIFDREVLEFVVPVAEERG